MGEEFTDMFEESDPDGNWNGDLKNRDYRLVHFLEKAFHLGACAAALQSGGHPEEYDKTIEMFESLSEKALGKKVA